MLKVRPHLGQYFANWLVWICEIHFFSEEWSLQLPKPDHHLPVSQPVIHVSYQILIPFPLFSRYYPVQQIKDIITFSCTL